MATSYDFSRAVDLDITAASGAVFTAVITFARDDSVAVDWTGKKIYFQVFKSKWTTRTEANAELSWNTDDDTEFTFNTATFTFNGVLADEDGDTLQPETYYYHIIDEDDVIIAFGELTLL